MGPDLATIVDPAPFLEAFVVLIIIPLALAWGTQTLAAHHRAGQVTQTVMAAAMVPRTDLHRRHPRSLAADNRAALTACRRIDSDNK